MNTWKKRLAVLMAVGCIGGAVAGMSACGESKVAYTIVLTDQDGNAVVGAELTLLQGETEIGTGTTDADGKFSGEAVAGEYVVDVGELPVGYLHDDDMVEITISEEMAAVELVATNNTPNGTQERPFTFVGDEDGEMQITLPAGQTHYYNVPRPMGRTLIVEGTDIEIVYGGTTYTPESGRIELAFASDSSNTYAVEQIAIVSKSSDLLSLALKMPVPEGSVADKAILITALDTAITATVKGSASVYYTWTATGSGTLTISSASAGNSLYMYNEDTYRATEWAENSVEITVNEGDKLLIQIGVAGNPAATDVNEIVFTLSLTTA